MQTEKELKKEIKVKMISQWLPQKNISVGALYLFEDKILIVKPRYNIGWLIPGDVVRDNESPLQALERALTDEMGLNLPIGELVAVDYTHSVDSKNEHLQIVFWGTNLNSTQAQHIQSKNNDDLEFKFTPLHEVQAHLASSLKNRMKSILDSINQNQFPLYLENGIRPTNKIIS